MRIIVNDIAASSGGALIILKSFYDFILEDEEAKKHEWIFLLSDTYLDEREHIKIIVAARYKNWLNKIYFDYIHGKNLIKRLNPDIIFSLQNTYTYGINCPQVIYMHQSLPFQKTKKFSFINSDERKLAIYQYLVGRIIKESLRKADHIIVQTNWIRDAVVDSTGINPRKITKLLPPMPTFREKKKDDEFSSKSFFYPASKEKYKNHQVISEAVNLVLSKGFCDFEVIFTEDIHSGQLVIVNKGKMKFEDVLNQYNKSTLIFPSYIETIGLPLLEARKLGTLILAADTPFSREALESYRNAYFFDPFNEEDLANLMLRVITGDIKKKIIEDNDIDYTNTWRSALEILNNEVKLGY